MSRQRELNLLINRNISNKREKSFGVVVTVPKLKTIGGKESYVCDVLLKSNGQVIKDCLIAQNNREIKNSVNINTNVELKRSNAGLFTIVGRSNIIIPDTNQKTFNINSLGIGGNSLAFLAGLAPKDKTGNNFKTIIGGNDVTLGTQTETTTTFTVERIPFGELDFGTDEFGKTRLVQTTT